jgi:hypothetical protein
MEGDNSSVPRVEADKQAITWGETKVGERSWYLGEAGWERGVLKVPEAVGGIEYDVAVITNQEGGDAAQRDREVREVDSDDSRGDRSAKRAELGGCENGEVRASGLSALRRAGSDNETGVSFSGVRYTMVGCGACVERRTARPAAAVSMLV